LTRAVIGGRIVIGIRVRGCEGSGLCGCFSYSLPEWAFIEVHVKCDLEVCKRRDPKGLYKKALAGEIKDFTGISSPYEEPVNPEIVVETDIESVNDMARKLMETLKAKDII